MKELVFTRLDWLVAWRHLRAGDERPAWVIPLILTSVYLILVGFALAFHAYTIDMPDVPEVEVFGPFGPIEQDDLGRRVMGDELYRSYINLKQSEWWSYHNSISQWEIEEYLTKF